MKRTLELLAVCALLLVSASCFNNNSKGDDDAAQEARKELNKEIKELNSLCPFDYDGFSLVGASVEGNDVVMDYVFQEAFFPIEKLNVNDNAVKKFFANILAGEENIADIMIKSKCGLKIRCKDQNTNGKATIALSSEDLKDAVDHPMTQSEQLEALLGLYKSAFPIQMDEGIWMTDINIDGEDANVVCEVDDNNIDLSLIANNEYVKQALKEEMKQTVVSDSDDPFFQMILASNKNLCFSYVGKKSGQQVKVRILNSELR